MGTRSRIGLALGPDQIVSVYCHYDGYIEHNGRKLVEHYNTAASVHELINGGDMSSLHSTHRWDSAPLKKEVYDAEGNRSVEYITDDENQWVYSPVKAAPAPLYYSERGEDAPPKFTDFEEFLSGDSGEECAICSPLVVVGKHGNSVGVTLTPLSMISSLSNLSLLTSVAL